MPGVPEPSLAHRGRRWHFAAMDLTIRAASAADVPELHRIRLLVHENRLSEPDKIGEAAYFPYVAAGTAWVAEMSGGICGFGIWDRRDGTVWALFVAPEAEGAGIGRALHDRILAEARRFGHSRHELTTTEGSRAAAFYRRAGWEAVGPRRDRETRFRRMIAL